MNTKILGVIVVFFFGLLLVLTSAMDRSNLRYSAEEMITLSKTAYVLDSLPYSGDYLKIDLSEPQLFTDNDVESTVNIPFAMLLNREYVDIWQNDQNKVLTGVSEMELHQAWMLLTQLGYKQLYVLEE